MLVFYLAAIDSDESKNKFEYIYRKYYRFMLRTASSIIRDSSLAEDAVHETFVQLLKEIDSLRIDNEKSLQSYLYILTRERTIDFLRKWERRRGVLTDYENRSTSFDNFKEPEEIALTNLQLNKAVSILSDKQQNHEIIGGFLGRINFAKFFAVHLIFTKKICLLIQNAAFQIR